MLPSTRRLDDENGVSSGEQGQVAPSYGTFVGCCDGSSSAGGDAFRHSVVLRPLITVGVVFGIIISQQKHLPTTAARGSAARGPKAVGQPTSELGVGWTPGVADRTSGTPPARPRGRMSARPLEEMVVANLLLNPLR